MTADVACSHLEQVAILEPPGEVAGCEECLKIGSGRVHLRTCQTCGKVGCCDSSPNRHARRHAAEDGHPIARSIEPGEEWSWCYRDEQLLGKLAAKLAPPEPQLQHAALRLGVRG